MPIVNHWPLQEDSGSTATDERGSNDGTINGATLGQPGILGNTAYEFGGSDYVDVSVPITGSGSFSMSMWVRTTVVTDHDLLIWGTDSTDSAVGAALRGSSNTTARFIIWGNDFDVTLPSGYDDGEFHHFLNTYNSNTGTVRVFWDGEEINSASRSPAPSQSNGVIGENFSGYRSGGGLQGRLCDVRTYDHAFTQGGVDYLHEVGSKGYAAWASKVS